MEELKDYDFGIGEEEMRNLLGNYTEVMRQSVDDAWIAVVAGIALDHGFAHRGMLRDC